MGPSKKKRAKSREDDPGPRPEKCQYFRGEARWKRKQVGETRESGKLRNSNQMLAKCFKK
jgi:hypothetical protein